MRIGENTYHIGYTTDVPNVGDSRCIKLVHKRTGVVTYKVEHFRKTFKTLNGLRRYADKIRDEWED